MDQRTIGFIGSGRVTAFMIEGLFRAHTNLAITVMDANPAVSENLAQRITSVTNAGTNSKNVGKADFLFIALPPPNVQAGCESIAPFVGQHTIVVSLAPKASISALSNWLGTDKIARYIPNAATSIGEGYNPVAWGSSISESDRKLVRELLSVLGDMPEVDETNLETYAVLSAMGPTYLWPLLDEMITSGVRYGLTPDESARLVSRMAVASANMIEAPGKDYATRMDMIPSKPMADIEQDLRGLFRAKLDAIHAKLSN
ncbi:MAG TPA: NAD(P)-binding domain-containing protein [Treponemataceae bacterium]|nr:NAD(P)-binding domain-containing protein [Treponemataceae bacterium]